MSDISQSVVVSPTTYISHLSKIITEDFLHISDRPIGSRGLEILNKLERYYIEEGCEPSDNDNTNGLKSEKQFILRSLPYVSSVIQLGSTIQNFSDAMEQIEKVYDLEDKPFDQAIKLSYVVFVELLNRGYDYFQGYKNPPNYDDFKLAEGAKKRDNPPATRETLWEEMNTQLQNLLKDKLKPPANGQKGFPWYTLARRHARQILDMFEELNNQLVRLEKLEEKSVAENEIGKTKDEIKKYARAMLENLGEAIKWDSQCRKTIVNEKTFVSIREKFQTADEDFNEIRNDAVFKDLFGE